MRRRAEPSSLPLYSPSLSHMHMHTRMRMHMCMCMHMFACTDMHMSHVEREGG